MNNPITSKKIFNLAQVSLGFIVRTKSNKSLSGEIRLIQMRDVTKDGCIDNMNFVFVPKDIIRPNNILKLDDIIIANRGNFHKTAVFERNEPTVVDSNFFVIRIKTKEVLPHYLSIYLNQENVQKKISRLTAGTSTQKISLEDVKDFEIPIPPLKIQKEFIEIAKLKRKENQLLSQLKEKKELLIDSLLMQKVTYR